MGAGRLGRVWAVAANTFRETVRERVLYNLVFFAIIMTLAAADQVTHDPELGLDYSRVVHGEQRFVYTRPVRAGDRLVTTIVVETIRSAAGNDMITTRADVATEDGEPVVSAYSTLVARGTAEAETAAS